jgi:hypothetical protein
MKRRSDNNNSEENFDKKLKAATDAVHESPSARKKRISKPGLLQYVAN